MADYFKTIFRWTLLCVCLFCAFDGAGDIASDFTRSVPAQVFFGVMVASWVYLNWKK